MSVQVVVKPVYFSPRKRRHYVTARAAARAEATARMVVWFPTERGDSDTGDPGWHFTGIERLAAARDRLAARYLRQIRDAERELRYDR